MFNMSYNPPLLKKIYHNTRRVVAKYWLSLMPVIQIAVTGSQGKTNTTQAVFSILSTIGNAVATDINLDTIYNVPITALKVMPWTKFVIFELGIDHVGEMDKHLEIVKPKIVVVTGISPVHTDKEHLGSLPNLIREKQKLIESLPDNGYAILNYDDENVRKMAGFTRAKILWYGTDKKHCDIWTDDIKVSLQGTSFALHTTYEVVQVQTKLIGRHHIYTIMPAFLVWQIIAKNQSVSFSQLSPLPGRMNVEQGPLGTIILNDSLRANPASTASGLQTLDEIDYKKGRKIAVLAEMGELEKPQEEHKKIGQLIGRLNIDYLIAIGPLQKYVAENAIKSGMKKENVFWVKDVFDAAKTLKKIIKTGDLIYLKGSFYRGVGRVISIISSWRNT